MPTPPWTISSITTTGTAVLLVLVSGAPAADPPAKAVPQTAMAKLTATMKRGEWAELKTENLVAAHRARGASGAIFGYNEGAAWDEGLSYVVHEGKPAFTLREAIAHASWGEATHPQRSAQT